MKVTRAQSDCLSLLLRLKRVLEEERNRMINEKYDSTKVESLLSKVNDALNFVKGGNLHSPDLVEKISLITRDDLSRMLISPRGALDEQRIRIMHVKTHIRGLVNELRQVRDELNE